MSLISVKTPDYSPWFVADIGKIDLGKKTISGDRASKGNRFAHFSGHVHIIIRLRHLDLPYMSLLSPGETASSGRDGW